MSWQSGATDVEMECEELEIKREKKMGSGASDNSYGPALFGEELLLWG